MRPFDPDFSIDLSSPVTRKSSEGSPSPPSTARNLLPAPLLHRRSIERVRQEMHQRLYELFDDNRSRPDESTVADIDKILDRARYLPRPSNDGDLRLTSIL